MVYTCPYCNVSCSDLNAKVVRFYESPEKSGMWDVMLDTGSAIYDSVFLEFCTCPECHKTSVHLESICSARRDFKFSFTFPSISAACFPDYVPVAIQQDYDEAIAVLDASPKAAATLARRCLQGMIHDFWQIHEKNLNAEITALKGNVPADQWAAINSHATEASISQISTNQQNISSIQTTIGSFGDVVTHNANEFATASQGAKADTALQPGDAVPQYSTLPAPTAASLGTIVLYTGQTNLNYTNGYFYTVSPVYSPASATIAQTVGDSLVGLTVDVDTFVAEEQPTQSGNTSFVASAQTTVTPLTVGEYVNGEYIEATINPQVFFAKAREVFGDSVVDNGSTVILGIIDAAWNMAVCIDGDEHRVNGQIAEDWGVVYNQVPTTGGGATAWLSYAIEREVTWSKNGTTVDLTSYGISYSGSPTNGDEITVSYVAPGITGYTWTEKLVQPRTTITMITED